MNRPLATALVITVALVAAPSLWPSSGIPAAATTAKAESSARSLGPAEKKARAQALAGCRKIDAAPKRKACIRRVNRKYRQPPTNPVTPPAGPVEEVLVRDKYFFPTELVIPKGGSVLWVWGNQNADAHNVTLLGGPKGVSPYDFETPLSPSVNYTFKRRFEVPGTYRFACSLHHLMEMTVEVGG